MPDALISSLTSPLASHLTIRASDRRVSLHEWFTPFEPPAWLRGGHRQTLAGNYWPRQRFAVPAEACEVLVDAGDGSRVLCHCHWQPEAVRAEQLTVLLVHGLEGSSDSQYIRGISMLAWNAGCNVIRMNMRNCGGTESWTPTLYHSGLSGDVGVVLHHFATELGLRRVAMVGYSMGGNLVMKLAGELGDSAPEWLLAAVGVSPAADLAASADALNEPANRMYERHFLRNLMRRFRGKAALFPEIYDAKLASRKIGPVRTIRDFDERITARFCGFTGADDYYFRASAARVAGQITIPTLVIHALDDPFIRMLPETRETLEANPAVTLVETQHGGHCAFLNARAARSANAAASLAPMGRHWAETTLMRFLMATAGHGSGS